MPTRNHTRLCGRKRVRVTTCEGSVGLAIEREEKPTIYKAFSSMNLTSAEAQTLRDLLIEALDADPFTRMSASQ